MLYSKYLVMPEILGTSKNIYKFDPRSIPGCIIWNDASQLSSISGSWPNLAVDTTYTVSCTGTLSIGGKNGLNTVLLNSSTPQTWATSPVVTLSTYTMFWSGRQTGGTNGRVLESVSNNQLFGYWGGQKKVIYVLNTAGTAGDPSQLVNTNSDTAWDLMSHSRTVSGPFTFNWNGTSVYSASSSSSNNFSGLAINQYEASDCEIGEILLYNVVLTTEQIQQIEGYLAWKWGVQTNLPIAHPLYTVQPFTRYFNPIDIPRCTVWLDGSDVSTITGSITSITDKVNGVVFTVTTSVKKSTIGSNGSLSFLGNGYLSGSVNNLLVGTSFVVFKATAANNGYYPFFTWSDSGLTLPAFGYVPGGNTIAPYTTNYGAGTPTNSVTIGNTYLTSYSWSGTTTAVGINGATPTSGTQGAYSSTSTVMLIGYDSGYYTTVNIGEIILYNSILTTSQRQQVEGYLAWKWGITLTSTNLLYKFPPLSSARFLPIHYGGCRLWLDGADPSKVTGTSPVTGWTDKSGNAVTTTFSGSPTYASTTSTLTFPASAYFYAAVDIRRDVLPNMTIFVVYQYTPNTGVSSALWGDDNGGGWNRLQLLDFNANSSYSFSTTDGNGTIETVTGLNTSNKLIYAYVISNHVINVYVNGASAITQFTEISTSPTSDTNIYFASIAPANSAGGGVTINEIAIYDRAFPTLQRQAFEGYLADKWKLQGNLSTTHPYYRYGPVQVSKPAPIISVTVSIASTTLTASWSASPDALSYTALLYTCATSGGAYKFVSMVSTTSLSQNFTLSVANYYKVYVIVVSANNSSDITQSSYISYSIASTTWSFTSAYSATSTPTLAINGSLVSAATSFNDTITGSPWYFNTTGYGGYTNPTSATMTIDSTNKVIKLPGTTYGFLSYGTWNQSTIAYPTANTSTGFGALHTVIIIYWKYGANIGSGGEGSGNSVTSGSIIYSLGRSSAYNYPTSGAGTYTGEIVTGEMGVWTYGFGPNGSTGYGSQISYTGSGISTSTATGWVCEAFTFQRSSTCAYYRATGPSSGYTFTTASTMTGSGQYVDGSLYVGVDQRDTYYGGDYGNLLNGGIAFFGMWNSYFTLSQFQAFVNAAGPQFGTFI